LDIWFERQDYKLFRAPNQTILRGKKKGLVLVGCMSKHLAAIVKPRLQKKSKI